MLRDEIHELRKDPSWLIEEDKFENQSFLQEMLRTFSGEPMWTDGKLAEKVFGMLYASVANTPMVAANTILFINRSENIKNRVQNEISLAYRCGLGRMTTVSGMRIHDVMNINVSC
jgi:hypothetical protein